MLLLVLLVAHLRPTSTVFDSDMATERKPPSKIDVTTTAYVPLGRNFRLECAAYNVASKNGSVPSFAEWIFVREGKKLSISSPYTSRIISSFDGKYLYGYLAQKSFEGYYDCEVEATDESYWVSQVSLVVQDCGTEENELKAYKNERNPCQYGACVIEPFPSDPVYSYLKCNCVTQYTGEFCDVLVEGALIRELINFSPFIGHVLAFLSMFIFYFCCRHGGSKPKISLADEVPEMPRTIDDPKLLYPAALLPEIEEEQHDEELDAFAVTKLLKELQKS